MGQAGDWRACGFAATVGGRRLRSVSDREGHCGHIRTGVGPLPRLAIIFLPEIEQGSSQIAVGELAGQPAAPFGLTR